MNLKFNNSKIEMTARWVVLVGVIIAICLCLMPDYNRRQQLKGEHSIAKGIIYGTNDTAICCPPKHVEFYYIYTINGVDYKGEYVDFEGNDFSFHTFKYLKYKTVNVLYMVNNPSINKALLLEKDYREFDLAYPDSVKWIEKL
ncbi:MAG: hypothetical protein M0D57_20525 [Sphingobacteriales bacterium JAD_PAG50586_3]|nr:MAG: hypothetical protein M0D57_20525 [Sphingobacteriales bacterium JAD_PAG50586_3]